jgi:hypothetical protein
MVTDSILVDPNEKMVLSSLRTILEKIWTNEFNHSTAKLHEHVGLHELVGMIHATKKLLGVIFKHTNNLFQCSFCKERVPNTQPYGNKFRRVKSFNSRSEDESNEGKVSKANRTMNPFPNGAIVIYHPCYVILLLPPQWSEGLLGPGNQAGAEEY